HFWREVGRRMDIRDIPDDYDVYDHFNQEYERTRFRFTEANRRVGTETIEMFARWFPRPLRSAVRRSMVALMDPPLLEAFGFTPPFLPPPPGLPGAAPVLPPNWPPGGPPN